MQYLVMDREQTCFEDAIPHRKMSQYISTYHQGSVIKTDFENIKLKEKGVPTVESLSCELQTLRESAQNGIQMTWSEIEQLEKERTALVELNLLVQEKISALQKKNAPISGEDEILEGWGEETPDDEPWLGWNISSKSVNPPNGIDEDEWCVGESISSRGNDHIVEKSYEVPLKFEDPDSNFSKQQKNTFRPLSLFVEKKFHWKKNKPESEMNGKDLQSNDCIKDLRQRLANLELQSMESCQQLKEQIRARDDSLKSLATFSEKQEKNIEDSLKELRRIRLRLKEKPDKVPIEMNEK